MRSKLMTNKEKLDKAIKEAKEKNSKELAFMKAELTENLKILHRILMKSLILFRESVTALNTMPEAMVSARH